MSDRTDVQRPYRTSELVKQTALTIHEEARIDKEGCFDPLNSSYKTISTALSQLCAMFDMRVIRATPTLVESTRETLSDKGLLRITEIIAELAAADLKVDDLIDHFSSKPNTATDVRTLIAIQERTRRAMRALIQMTGVH
jgi:hypothetical protein